MRRYVNALLILAIVLVAPAVAVPASRAMAQDTAEVSFWLDTTGGAEGAECRVENAVDPFNALGNGVKVNATLQANNWDATRTSLAGGAGPDVIGTPGPSFAMQLALAGQLLPLDEFAEQFGWNDRFAEGSLNLGMANDQLVTIPDEIETLVLYYNKTLFEQNGWEPPKTLDELTALAEQINAAGIIPFAHANAEWRPANEWFVGEFLNHSAGGPQKVYDALVGKTPWTDPDLVTAIESLNQMQQNGWFSGGLDRYYTLTEAEAGSMFGSGEAAMKIEGSWFLESVDDYFGEAAGNENEWGWVPMPSASGEAIFDLGIGQTYSINANSANPEATAQFLDYYFSPETQARLLANCGVVPAPVDLQGQDLSAVNPGLAEILAALNEAFAANNYGYTTWTFWPPESETYLIEQVEKVWAGEMTAEEYLQGHQEVFDKEREAGAVPPIPER
jgi:raffinose/stachyose/melibiose transport system substrate-binding protein